MMPTFDLKEKPESIELATSNRRHGDTFSGFGKGIPNVDHNSGENHC